MKQFSAKAQRRKEFLIEDEGSLDVSRQNGLTNHVKDRHYDY